MFSENIKLNKEGVKFTDKHGNPLGLSEASKKAVHRGYNWLLDFKLFLIHLVSLHVPFHSIRLFVFKLAGMKIGTGSTVHMGCKFFNPAGVRIGKDTIIGENAFLDGRAKLNIGSHVDMASEVMIYNSEHDISDRYFRATEDKVEIGDYVFIGPRVIILPGVKIGKGAIVAAGAVVTGNIEDFSVVGGVPAKVIGKRQNTNPSYVLGRARLFQ